MTDPLTRVCGLIDLSPEDRQRLMVELDFVEHVLSRIDQGAGFCEDRGFGWSAEMERAEGTGRLFARLREWPILRRLLPRLRHLRHAADPVIAREPTPTDDVLVAQLLLANIRSFEERCGEGWGERIVSVGLGPDRIQVNEASLATTVGGQPFDESEYAVDYSEDRCGPFWIGLREKLPKDTWRRAAALAERMSGAVLPCDLCGRTSQTLTLSGAVLTYDSPFSTPACTEVGSDARAALREAFAAHDMPAVRTLNSNWAEGNCSACDASYCETHLARGQADAEHLSASRDVRCPLGHCWEV